jgi:hypothetical protein
MDTSNRQERIVTPCPNCGRSSLFIGEGGHLTCSVLTCSEPSAERANAQQREGLADALRHIEWMQQVLAAVKVRVAFVGWPREPRREDGVPDWRREIALIEEAEKWSGA